MSNHTYVKDKKINSLNYFLNELDKIKEENKLMKELLNEVLNDDGSRYNRPSYYYKIKDFLNKGENNG